MSSLGIDRLSISERLGLVEEIWNSIATTPDEVLLTQTQRQDLDARLAEYDKDPEEGSTWEEVKARLQGGKPRSL